MSLTKLGSITKKFVPFQFLVLGLISSCTPVADEAKAQKQQTRTNRSTELTISAAASMQDVLTDIKELYNQHHPQVNIAFNFGSSGSLQHQIEQGAPIDIFISAAPKQMNNLEAKKLLVPETRQNLVKNQMVLIVPEDNQSIANFEDLTKESTKLISLGEPNSVPAGEYAQEILSNLDIINTIKPKSIYGKNVRQVLSYVSTGNVDAGIVYRTDAAIAKQVKIVATAPSKNYSSVVYPAAVVKDSKYPQAAKQVLQFLLSAEAQAIFKKHGFLSISNSQ